MPVQTESCALWGARLADSRSSPLAGKRVVLTRSAEQSAELKQGLESLGAEVLLLPLVCFAPPLDWAPADVHLRRLAEFDAVLFLSANAVRYVFDRCAQLGVTAAHPDQQRPLIAAVGPATARALAAQGIRVDYVAREHTGEALARELKDSLAGRSVLLPRSDQGNEAVSQQLRDLGANVTEIVAYRTMMPEATNSEIAAKVRGGDVDAIVFASPSAVQNFVHFVADANLARKIASQVRLVAIGPTTAEALRGAELSPSMVARESSAAGLIDAMEGIFETRAPSASSGASSRKPS